jgi:GntR family transcriptional regulator
MALDIPHGGAPLFRRIADTLADAIARGEYPVHGRIPPEFTLMRMFGASRFTIREALADLRSRGLIASRRGSGTIVLRQAARTPVFSEAYNSIDDFFASTVEAPLEALAIADVVADSDLASRLRCETGRQFLQLHGLRHRRGQPHQPPIAVVHAYFNATYSAIRPRLSALTESIAGTAEKLFGVRVQRIVQELEPALLSADEARILIADEGGPALAVRRWYYLGNGEALLISRSIYPQGRLIYKTELRRSEPPAADQPDRIPFNAALGHDPIG